MLKPKGIERCPGAYYALLDLNLLAVNEGKPLTDRISVFECLVPELQSCRRRATCAYSIYYECGM